MDLALVLVDNVSKLTSEGHFKWLESTEDQFYCKEYAGIGLTFTRLYAPGPLNTPLNAPLELLVHSNKLTQTLRISSVVTTERDAALKSLWTAVADSIRVPQAAIRTVLEQLNVSVSVDLDSDAVQRSREVALAPEILADALQDRVTPSSGPLLNASPVFKRFPSQEDLKELVALGAMLVMPERDSADDLWECVYEGRTVRLRFVPGTAHPWKVCVLLPGGSVAFQGATPKEAIECAVAPMRL